MSAASPPPATSTSSSPPSPPQKRQPNPFVTRRQRFKSGMRMEAWKFSLYVLIPIVASAYFNSPDTQKYWADYFQYIRYPPVKESFSEMVADYRKRNIQQQEQRKAYAEQMSVLEESAERSRKFQQQLQQEKQKTGESGPAERSSSNPSSWRWLSWGSKTN